MNNMKPIVAILGCTAGVAGASEALLSSEYPKHEFKTFKKFSELPAGGDCTILTVGLPNYLPVQRDHKLIVVNAKYEEDPAKQKEMWEMLRDESAKVEDIIPILAEAHKYTVYPEQAVLQKRVEFMQSQIDLSKCQTDEEKLEALEAQIEILSQHSPITGS